MDFNLLWKTLIMFNFSFFLIWVSFDTYRAEFMNDHDFVDPATGNRGTTSRNDASLSMAGRSLIFLIAIISALIVSILYFIMYNNYIKPSLKCVKGKGLKSCKLVK